MSKINIADNKLLINNNECELIGIEIIDGNSSHIVTDNATICFVYGETTINDTIINSYEELLANFEQI